MTTPTERVRRGKGARRQVPIRMPVTLANELAAAAERWHEPRGEIVCAALHAFLRANGRAQRRAVTGWLTKHVPEELKSKRG